MEYTLYKDLLTSTRSGLLKEIKDIENSLQHQEAASDELDIATNVVNTEMLNRLLERQLIYVKKVNIALKKIEDETYGECDACGEMISPKRLLARPVASLCLLCKEKQERREKAEKLPRGFLSED